MDKDYDLFISRKYVSWLSAFVERITLPDMTTAEGIYHELKLSDPFIVSMQLFWGDSIIHQYIKEQP